MKKICTLFLFLSGTIAFADESSIQEARTAWARDYFAKKRGPVPDGGITILPEKEMSQYNRFKDERIKSKNDILKYGYINKEEPKVRDLLQIRKLSQQDFKNNEMNYRASSTHLRHDIYDLKMAYTFVGVPKDDMSEFIGVAPFLTYLKGQGWVGAKQFFIKNGIGNCVFSENNVCLSHGSVVIAKEDVREDINNKITTVEVVGSPETGFLYNIEWFDSTFFRQLECANEKYSEKVKQDVIELAKRIDLN